MGELLLCSEPMAAMPYYLEDVGLNIYSLEELSYYILHNLYLLDRSFMSEELCSWIEKELGEAELSCKLGERIQTNARLSVFLTDLLEWCGYCTKAEITQITQTIEELESKSHMERGKLKADRLMEKEQYLLAVYEYRELLDASEAENASAHLTGAIWHNLGAAYAGMFLFDEAVSCYEKAYQYHGNKESLFEALMMYDCLDEHEKFQKMSIQYGITAEEQKQIKSRVAAAEESPERKQEQKKIEALEQLQKDGTKEEFQTAVKQMIFEWKEEYRSKSRC